MTKNKDRWSALSMQERADLMNMYITNGISDLKEMKKHYNSFGDGGDIENIVIDENQTVPKSEVVNTSNYRQQIETYNQLRQDATEAFNNYDWSKLKTLRDEADSLGRELAKYTLNEYSKYTSSPLNYGNWAGTINAGEPQDIRYLLKSNIREDGKEATEWLKSYINSDGFQRIRKNQKNWWEARHPYQKYLYFLKEDKRKINNYVSNINDNIDKTHNFVLDGYPAQSFAQPYIGRTFTFKRPIEEDKEHPFYETQMHEIDHLFNTTAVHYDTINAEVLDQNTNTKKNHHDEYRDEKHSDNIGVKYLLFKEGIYDARSNEDVTPEQIQQLREKYPKLRFLQQLNNEEAAFQINNVAQNTSNKDRLDYISPENIAANGGKLNRFNDGGNLDGDSPQSDIPPQYDYTKYSKDELIKAAEEAAWNFNVAEGITRDDILSGRITPIFKNKRKEKIFREAFDTSVNAKLLEGAVVTADRKVPVGAFPVGAFPIGKAIEKHVPKVVANDYLARKPLELFKITDYPTLQNHTLYNLLDIVESGIANDNTNIAKEISKIKKVSPIRVRNLKNYTQQAQQELSNYALQRKPVALQDVIDNRFSNSVMMPPTSGTWADTVNSYYSTVNAPILQQLSALGAKPSPIVRNENVVKRSTKNPLEDSAYIEAGYNASGMQSNKVSTETVTDLVSEYIREQDSVGIPYFEGIQENTLPEPLTIPKNKHKKGGKIKKYK